MPLTLITGPANAAKAGAVLERFRAALAARAGARGADVGRRRALPARAGGRGHRGRRRGAHVLERSCGRWRRRRACARACSAPSRASGWCGRSSPSARPRGAGAVGRRARASPAAAGSAVRRARPLAGRPGAVRARGARLGGGGRRAGARRRARRALLGLPPPAGARSARSTARGLRGRRSTPLRERPGGVGRAGRCSCTGSTT